MTWKSCILTVVITYNEGWASDKTFFLIILYLRGGPIFHTGFSILSAKITLDRGKGNERRKRQASWLESALRAFSLNSDSRPKYNGFIIGSNLTKVNYGYMLIAIGLLTLVVGKRKMQWAWNCIMFTKMREVCLLSNSMTRLLEKHGSIMDTHNSN